MTTTTTLEPKPLPYPQPQPHRLSACHRHPDEPVTGFCASCLRERLKGLDPATSRSKPTSSSSAVLKSVFFKAPPNPSSSSRFLPELRRCKSFSGDRGGPVALEPQRKSCDVRVRNTLWSLFHLDDGGHRPSSSAAVTGGAEVEIECRRNLGSPPGVAAVPVREEEEEVMREEEEEQGAEMEDAGEIRAVNPVLVEETKEIEDGEELRTMKDHIDLDSQSRKPPPKDLKEIAGSFWLAASVFSKKLQKWRRKQKLKKLNRNAAAAMHAAKPSNSQRFRETQSEIAVDVFGRRSCDTDPRFSLDVGRISFDDPRHSWDEPRASWDGYLNGSRSLFPRFPPMVSVVEDVPAVTSATVQLADGRIPVEEDSTTPGGCTQTRDYYSDSSQRRRRSLDRSSSVKKSMVEVDDPKPGSNAKVSPAMGTEFFHHLNQFEREFRESNFNSLREFPKSFESGYKVPQKDSHSKKSNRWSKAWRFWGLIHRHNNSRDLGGNAVERSSSESWPELRQEGNNRKVLRSNSSVGSGCSTRRSTNGTNGQLKKKREEFGLERNQSTRYSPSHIDNGLLRFYLTPMRSSRRSSGSGNGRHKASHSFTRSILRLY